MAGQGGHARFSKENPRPGPGRPKMTEEEKWKARIQRSVNFDFKQRCAALLPIAVDQLAQAYDKQEFKGRDLVNATEMLRDTVHGRPSQAITGAGGGPLMISFAQVLGKVDGKKREAL